jgi:hypothetical protein
MELRNVGRKKETKTTVKDEKDGRNEQRMQERKEGRV